MGSSRASLLPANIHICSIEIIKTQWWCVSGLRNIRQLGDGSCADNRLTSASGPLIPRLCCKSRKLQGDEAPNIFRRKPRMRPLEFVIIGTKRLLQHNLPEAD